MTKLGCAACLALVGFACFVLIVVALVAAVLPPVNHKDLLAMLASMGVGLALVIVFAVVTS